MGNKEQDLSTETARQLLDWQVSAGADEAVLEDPVNHFAEAPAPEPDMPAPAQAAAVQAASATPDDPAMAARAQAASAQSVDEIRVLLERFEGCALCQKAKNLCFYDGDPNARVMFMGEAPGAEEDRQGVPFVGRAGQLLDRMLAAIGMERGQVFITNTVYWRPPGNRTPTPQETQACRPFGDRVIELVDPDVIVFLGGAAAKEMLATNQGILRMRGKWRTFETGKRTIRAMATLHPAYLLRQPGQKRLAWRDFVQVAKALEDAPQP